MIQQKFIDWVLVPIAKQTNKIPLKAREWVFVLAGVAMIARSLFNDMVFVTLPYILTYAIGCVLMGLMLLASLPSVIRPVKVRVFPTVCWFGVGVLMLVTSLLYNIDWISDALMFLAVCPVTFVIWGNVEQNRLLRLINRTCLVSFVVFIVASMIFVPVQDRQYPGVFYNVNGTALYLILVFACLLIEVLRPHQKKWILAVHMLLLGMCGTLIFYTNSRTGQVAALLAFAVVFGFAFVRDFKDSKKAILFKLLCAALAFVIMLPATVHVFRAGNRVASTFMSSYQSETDTDVRGSFRTFLEHNKLKTQTAGKDVSAMSTGRTDIWQEYLKESTLFGSDTPEEFWIESRQAYYSTAHMTWVTYAFRHGYVCAVLFLLYNISMGVVAVKYAFKRKKDYLALLPLSITLVFGVAALLASINTPFNYMVTIYYYFVQPTLLVKGLKEDEKPC